MKWIALLLCANATPLHRLMSVTVGMSHYSEVLKGIMHQLPAWIHKRYGLCQHFFFQEQFFNHFVPEVRRLLNEMLKISSETPGLF